MAEAATQGMSIQTKRASAGIGAITAVRPRMPKMLKMFDPTMLPTAISVCLRSAATTDVASSGSEVPTATMVSPITASEMP